MEIQKIKNIAFWIMILAVVSLCIYLIVYIKTESYQCINSPLTYGVSKYEVSGGEMFCTCTFGLSPQIMYVTKDNLTFLNINPNRLTIE